MSQMTALCMVFGLSRYGAISFRTRNQININPFLNFSKNWLSIQSVSVINVFLQNYLELLRETSAKPGLFYLIHCLQAVVHGPSFKFSVCGAVSYVISKCFIQIKN